MALMTYTSVGNKEDISDLITNISPTDTPLFSALGKGKASATYHEWLEDKLEYSGASNKKVEGFSYQTTDPDTRTRLGNFTQIMSNGYGVTETQETVEKHGVSSEIAYQMQRAMKQIAIDCEYALVNNATRTQGNSSTERQAGGIPYFVQTHVMGNSGSARDFTEEVLNDALQATWADGGKPGTVAVGGKQKRVMSGWTANTVKTMEAAGNKITQRISVYESDFGMVTVLLDRLLPAGNAYVLQTNLWKTCYLRPFKTVELPKTADKIEKIIVGELTFECRAEKANGLIKDLA